jgi:hypothetical protein
MNKVSILINKKKLDYEGPSSYDECTTQQYLQLHRFRQRMRLDPHSQFILLRLIYDIPERYAQYFFDKTAMELLGVKDTDEQDELTAQGMLLLETCAWIFEGENPSNWIAKLMHIRNGTVVYGPQDRLADLTFEDFMYAELYYSQRQFGKLMAVLYRMRHQQTKSRMVLNPEKIEHYADGFTNMPTSIQEAIYFNYEGCRRYLATCFTHVFQQSKEKAQAQNGTWLDVAIGMAGDDPMKFNALKKENVYIVLKMLDNSLAQVEKLKENHGSNS